MGAAAQPIADRCRHGLAQKGTVRDWVIVLTLTLLSACGGTPKSMTEQTPPVTQMKPPVARSASRQIPPVEFGRRPPNTPMTSNNMPFFDVVTYCELATGNPPESGRPPKTRAYEACVQYQDANRIVLGEAIDANRFDEADIIRCAKDSRTAYEGLWFCLNGQP